MKRKTVAIIMIGVALAFFVRYLTFTGETQGFPRKLGSMSMAQFSSGSEALSELTVMHLMSPEVKMVDAFIVEYEGTGDAVAIVYVSLAEDEEQAQGLLDLMNVKIDPSDGYTYVREMSLPGDDHPAVYYARGRIQ